VLPLLGTPPGAAWLPCLSGVVSAEANRRQTEPALPELDRPTFAFSSVTLAAAWSPTWLALSWAVAAALLAVFRMGSRFCSHLA
jgi:hypothetical protein